MSGRAYEDPNELDNALTNLLAGAANRAGSGFAGLGVIVSDDPGSLPLYPIGPPITLASGTDTIALLGDLAIEGGAHHDGFHVLDLALNLKAVSQYFSPPVVTGLEIDRSRRFGGRYLAAMFGSVLPGVLATGISTPTLGVITFRAGSEIHGRLAHRDTTSTNDVCGVDGAFDERPR